MRCALEGAHKLIEFQNIALNELKEKRLYITNNNPTAIDLTLPNLDENTSTN